MFGLVENLVGILPPKLFYTTFLRLDVRVAPAYGIERADLYRQYPSWTNTTFVYESPESHTRAVERPISLEEIFTCGEAWQYGIFQKIYVWSSKSFEDKLGKFFPVKSHFVRLVRNIFAEEYGVIGYIYLELLFQ